MLFIVGLIIVSVAVVIVPGMGVPGGVHVAPLGWSSERWPVEHRPPVPGLLRRGAHIIGDFLGGVGIVLCIPFAILALGIPIALCVRMLLWIAGML